MFAILSEKELNDIRGMRLMPESWVIVRAPWECVSMVCCQHCRLGRTQNPWTDHTQAAKFDVGSASQRARGGDSDGFGSHTSLATRVRVDKECAV